MERATRTGLQYAFWRFWLYVAAFLATLIVPYVGTFSAVNVFGKSVSYLQGVWGNFDGVVFMLISQSGYDQSQVPFFPLYPLTIRLFRLVSGIPTLLSAEIVSMVAFLAALWVINKLLKLDGKDHLFGLFVTVLLAFPTAYHFTAAYSDALYLLLATSTVYFARKRQFLWASVLGGLATLCRLNGLALGFVLVAEFFSSLSPSKKEEWSWKVWWKRLRNWSWLRQVWKSRVWLVGIIPLAFLAYLFYIQYQFGDWRIFFTGVQVWHRDHAVLPIQTFWRYAKILFQSPRITFTYWIAFGEAAFTLLYSLVLIFSWRRIRLSYWLFMFFHLLIPTITGTLQGMPRYGLHLYPLFLCFAVWLDKKPLWVQRTWLTVSFLLQFAYLAYFTRGYFVS